jgi:ABC-type uncharacterized transport system auxiliary subunit
MTRPWLSLCLIAACGGSLPQTRYYALGVVAPAAPAARGDAPALAVEALATARPYDDERIIYRLDPYRLDYYPYDRWGTSPGELLASYLADAAGASGRFRSVVRDTSAPGVAVTLGGHVLAIEEIDGARASAYAHVAVELSAYDAATSQPLWTARYDEQEPMTAREPEALARSATVAMQRIAHRAIPSIADAAEHLRDTGAHATADRRRR